MKEIKISNELANIEKPELPTNWDYDSSVKEVKGFLVSWRNITEDVLKELWIAREMLSQSPSDAAKIMHGQVCPRTWQQYLEDIGLAKRTANNWLKRWTTPEQTETPELPPGEYTIFYADPPWQYSNTGFDESASQQYPTMALQKLKELKIPDMTSKQAVLFMWCTNPILPEGIELLKAWGFNYKTNMVWVKNKAPSMGWFLKTKHELLIIATRGESMHPEVKHESVIYADVTKHSKKPEIFYEMIEQAYPNQKYIELFARNKRTNWESWGNEL